MQITVTIDDALYDKVMEAADPQMDRNDIFREVMTTFVWVQTAKRLTALGGAQPAMQAITRRASDPTQH